MPKSRPQSSAPAARASKSIKSRITKELFMRGVSKRDIQYLMSKYFGVPYRTTDLALRRAHLEKGIEPFVDNGVIKTRHFQYLKRKNSITHNRRLYPKEVRDKAINTLRDNYFKSAMLAVLNELTRNNHFKKAANLAAMFPDDFIMRAMEVPVLVNGEYIPEIQKEWHSP